jgi:hypothetical protein
VKRLSKWKLRADEIRQLKRLFHSGCNCLELLGYTSNLDLGDVHDQLKKADCAAKEMLKSCMFCLLTASATVLFDESSSHYLPTEDLAALGGMTTIQLEQSW